ncbi:MAG TPA: response regulator [Vicinamibacterales bacterium]|jgi:PleD family two-component response regulator|nr:response regulator [Vicinamibacterales bacterium]
MNSTVAGRQSKPRVLVADDAPEITQLIAAWLRPEYDVFTAWDGEQALSVAERVEPTVALLDVAMPKSTGFQVAELFRQHPRLRRTRIIFVTGLRQPENAIRAIELGALDYLYKPLDEETILDRVRVAIELSRG